MATIKVKFRPSVVAGKEGAIYYQVIHKRVTRQIATGYRIFAHEWDKAKAAVIIGTASSIERRKHLSALWMDINSDLRKITEIIHRLDRHHTDYTADCVVASFSHQQRHNSFFGFMRDIIDQLTLMGKQRTAETYASTLKSFSTFREGKDIAPARINSTLMQLYEAHLHNRGLLRNSTSFYLRVLRAAYNRAVDKGLTAQREPFRYVYTGIDKTKKRAIPLNAIRRIKTLDLSAKPSLDFARDIFLFSFYTRGMSFIDIAFLKKKDLQNGVIIYRRHKTGQCLSIKWEKCMQEIIDKYPQTNRSDYMLPIIKAAGDIDSERRQYRSAMHLVNKKLKTISTMAHLNVNLTMYVSRHSWASAAQSQNIPISVISEGMGHDSENTTRIYLASIDTSAVDKANEYILKKLMP